MKPGSLYAAIAATTLLFAAPAFAGSITAFSSRAAFEAAVGGPVTVDTFGTELRAPISTGVLNSATNLAVTIGSPITPGLIQPGVTYSTPIGQGYFFNIDTAGGFTGAFLSGEPDPLTATFDGPVRAFGFDTRRIMGTELEVIINFTSGGPYVSLFAIPGAPSNDFFGFVSSARDIVSMTVFTTTLANVTFAIDNFTFSAVGTPGGTTVIPLPAPALMLATGLLAIGATARRRRSGGH